MSNGESKILKMIRNNSVKEEFDIKPIYKWILGIVFIVGGLYMYIKDIPAMKTDIAKHETKIAVMEANFTYIKEALSEIKTSIRNRNR